MCFVDFISGALLVWHLSENPEVGVVCSGYDLVC
jgi:hypothetical protein